MKQGMRQEFLYGSRAKKINRSKIPLVSADMKDLPGEGKERRKRPCSFPLQGYRIIYP